MCVLCGKLSTQKTCIYSTATYITQCSYTRIALYALYDVNSRKLLLEKSWRGVCYWNGTTYAFLYYSSCLTVTDYTSYSQWRVQGAYRFDSSADTCWCLHKVAAESCLCIVVLNDVVHRWCVLAFINWPPDAATPLQQPLCCCNVVWSFMLTSARTGCE